MLDPAELYEVEADAPQLDEPVLLVALDGFVDAGNARPAGGGGAHGGPGVADGRWPVRRRPARGLPVAAPAAAVRHRPLGRLHARPSWTSSRSPTPATPTYLLLAGPEPDTQWERFAAAVEQLVGSSASGW